MVYKPPTKEVSYETYSGVARVQVGKNAVRLFFKAAPDDPVVVKKENCPAEVRKGTWYVVMDEDKKEVRYIRP